MKSLDNLIAAFRRFPGVGPKQAERFALYVIRASEPEVNNLAALLHEVKETVGYCSECQDYTEKGLCSICSDSSRDHSVLCRTFLGQTLMHSPQPLQISVLNVSFAMTNSPFYRILA